MKPVPVLCLLLLAISTFTSALAGPREARALWDRAKALKEAPWRVRADAYRSVVREAQPTDRLVVRAGMALGRVLREAGHAHGAAAAEAHAVTTGPRGDEVRIRALLSHANALRDEGDRDAARPLLALVVDDARAEAPDAADRALEVLGEMAAEDGDSEALTALLERARPRAAPHVRIVLLGRLGLERLGEGDRAGAVRCLVDAERLFRSATSSDRADAETVLATKAWLDLPLRKVL